LQFLAKEKPFNFYICVDKHKNDKNYQMPALIVFHIWLKFLIPIIFIYFYIFSSFVFIVSIFVLLEAFLQQGFKKPNSAFDLEIEQFICTYFLVFSADLPLH